MTTTPCLYNAYSIAENVAVSIVSVRSSPAISAPIRPVSVATSNVSKVVFKNFSNHSGARILEAIETQNLYRDIERKQQASASSVLDGVVRWYKSHYDRPTDKGSSPSVPCGYGYLCVLTPQLAVVGSGELNRSFQFTDGYGSTAL